MDALSWRTYGAPDSDYPNPPKSVFQYPADGGGKGKGGGRGGNSPRRSGGRPMTPAEAAVANRAGRTDRGVGKGGGKGGGGRKRVQHDYM